MDVKEWFEKQPKWLNTGANWLIQREALSQDDIINLTNLCLKEAGVAVKKKTPSFEVFQPQSLMDSSTDTILLHSISNPLGVNALISEIPLEFSSNELNIIYGENGSGKSGYTRILKHVLGSKWKKTILNNVYGEKIKSEPQADISYSLNSDKKTESWLHPNRINALVPARIFDSKISNFYLNDKNEASYEPFLLVFFKQLSDLVKNVDGVITSYEQKVNESLLPTVLPKYSNILLVNKVFKLNHESNITELLSLIEWKAESEERLKELNHLLDTKDIDAQRNHLSSKLNQLNVIKKYTDDITSKLSSENLKAIITARRNSILATKSAQEYASSIFKNTELAGVGQQTWQAMWNSARKYSKEFAYVGLEYPNIENDAQCVLCHQVLDGEAKNRVNSFENFITSNLQSEAKNAEKHLKKLESNLPNIQEEMIDQLANQELDKKECESTVKAWVKVKKTALNSSNIDDSESLINPTIHYSIDKKISDISKQLTNLDQLADQEKKKNILEERTELEAKQWSFSYKEQIIKEHERLSNLQKLKVAKKTTISNHITKFKNKLAKKHLTSRYIESFNNELMSLGGGRIRAKVNQESGGKGSTFYRLSLEGTSQPASKVLSEGEAKLVTLAAFLADAQLNNASTPFIFDDPITSLDIRHEEKLVKRLAELSKSRQVIIFTHRISFLSLLDEEAKRSSINLNAISLMSTSQGSGKISDTLPFNASCPLKVINKLKNESLSHARKAWNSNEIDNYNILAKGICSNFRIALENIVEKILLSGIVKRYRRSVTTQNKIKNIAKITPCDCLLIDDFMTKYSTYEHSQSDEIATQIPDPDELNADFEKVSIWASDLKSRFK